MFITRFIAAAFWVCLCSSALAQNRLPDLSVDDNYDIVTVSKPTTRQHCRVDSSTMDSIRCEAKHGNPQSFEADDILAVIAPPSHANLYRHLLYLSAGAALITGGAFAPTLALSIPLYIFSILPLGSELLEGFLLRGECNYLCDDHSNDILVYKRLDIPLRVHLRGKQHSMR